VSSSCDAPHLLFSEIAERAFGEAVQRFERRADVDTGDEHQPADEPLGKIYPAVA